MPNPVEYAERTLGVHIPWQQAEELLEQHERQITNQALLKTQIRAVKASIDDRTFQVRTEAPSHPEWPAKGVQAQEKFLKVLIYLDEEIQKQNDKLFELHSEQDAIDSVLKHIEVSLHVLTARMNELSGLLAFYAAAKASAAVAAA